MKQYSVLTTLYAKENPEFLKQSIDSMLNQTLPPSEYVVVKDGPITDELEEVLKDYSTKYPIFKIIGLEVNSGLGVACIKGVEACSYDYIARLDSDDISLPNRCELEINMLEKEDDLAVIGSDIYEFQDDPSKVTAIKRMPIEPDEIYKFGKKRNPFNHSTVIFRKSLLQANGGYSPMRRSQDLELFTRLLFKGCKCRNIGEPLVLFRTGSARVKRKKNWTNLRCDVKVYQRNYNEHYINLLEFLYVVFRQVVFFLMPSGVAQKLYFKLYRNKA